MDEELRTARLRLVRAGPGDAALLLGLDADPVAMRFINGGRPSTRLEVDDRLADPRRRLWLAYEGEVFVGIFSLRGSSMTDVELGYRLNRASWRMGLATEGAGQVVAFAFEQLGVDRVWGQTMTVNVASRRVMERLGMRYLRTFHAEWPDVIEGGEHGDVEYELRREDWTGPTVHRPAARRGER